MLDGLYWLILINWMMLLQDKQASSLLAAVPCTDWRICFLFLFFHHVTLTYNFALYEMKLFSPSRPSDSNICSSSVRKHQDPCRILSLSSWVATWSWPQEYFYLRFSFPFLSSLLLSSVLSFDLWPLSHSLNAACFISSLQLSVDVSHWSAPCSVFMLLCCK